MKTRLLHIYFTTVVLLSAAFVGCGTYTKPYYDEAVSSWQQDKSSSGKKIVHSLYLVGDTGEIDDEVQHTNVVLEALKKNLAQEKVETSLVFLGDNIYPHGMPPISSEKRAEAERIITAQLDCAQVHDGTTYFIPGNHDWNKHKPGGRKAIKRQEKFIEEYSKDNSKIKFYPKDACGDPKVIKIHKDLVYVFLDTQWWLHDWSQEKNMNKGCEIKSRADLLQRMHEIMVEYKNDEIVILMHHPIKSDGTHGGYFSFKQHLFPLTELKDNLWIPLPIIGSAYAAYRKVTGSKQDIPHVLNQELMQRLDELAQKLRINIVFASGHDHGLQYFEDQRIRYIVSGAGGKIDYVRKGGEALYTRSGRGYVKIDFYKDFEAWAEFYIVDPLTGEAALEFRTEIRKPRPGTVEETVEFPPVTKKTKTIAANKELAAGGFKKLFLGSQYRDMWATEVEAEIIDLETKLGGLTPIKKGGGMASNSLRMEREDGRQYILRSIKKDYTKLVPPEFSNLKLIDVLEDQNSASHPYNALIIPYLSKAAGIYYTEPKLVYLQHQRGLGNYNSQFPEELYLLEERPSGDWSDAEQFGYAEKIISYSDLLETLREKKNHFIDQEWVLKSRLFDLFIHDWDRHDDQWRWTKIKEEGKNIYRPIPRDRDQAFYRFKGIVPWYISTFMVKQFKTIKEDCKDVKSLSYNARHFDRYFLHDLEWEEWKPIVSELQNRLTEQVIDEAVLLFPKEILSLDNDEELSRILKARRLNLDKIARRFYDFLAKEVEVTGTDNADKFVITTHPDGNVHLKVTVDSKNHGTLTKYERTFYPEETNEIRLYGLRGKDELILEGAEKSTIRIKIIGGEGKDFIKNKNAHQQIEVYDTPEGIETEGVVKNMTSTDLQVNEYDRYGFQYNSSLPLLNFGYTVDDRLWLGASISWINRSWRKDPYQSKQGFSFIAAPGSRDAYQIGYEGHFPNLLGRLDFAPTLDLSYPYYENYFGLGNNSTNDLSNPIEYNWVRMQTIDIKPNLRLRLGKLTQLDFGPIFSVRNISNTADRVSEDADLGFTDEEFQTRKYWGADARFSLSIVDNSSFPTNGFSFSTSGFYKFENSLDENIAELSLESQFYLRLLNKPLVVFANQFGYGKSFGDLQFFQYQDLGNNSGLRGFRNERYRGESRYYHNMDLRVRLIKWKNNFIPMDIGLLAGYDYGRVSLEGESFRNWHSSQTVGLWFHLLGSIVVQPYFSFIEEQNAINLRLGFNF